jgi:hypothetical protein
MELLLNPHSKILGADLLCPFCGSDYLHHGKVEIFDRQEDNETGLHVSVDASRVTLDSDISGNPSLRRQGLKIHFGCENCNGASILTLAQHKGTTYMKFLKPIHLAVL